MSKLIVHHLEDSRSQRILWLLEELNVDYEVKQYNRVKGRAPKELEAIFPLGKSPVITDRGLTIAESGAIIEYIIATYDQTHRLAPSTDSDNLRNTFWLHFAEGSLIPTLVLKQVFATALTQVSFVVKPILGAVSKQMDAQYIDPECRRNFGYVESELGKSEWFAGDHLTASDFQMSFPMEIADRGGCTPSTHPNIFKWRGKVGQMESYKRALKKGGMKYAYALS